MTPTICLAIAIALGVPADPRPGWREDFAPIPDQARPRPRADVDGPASPFGERTGQIVLRGCLNRPEGEAKLRAQGFGRVTADLTQDGRFYERWVHPDGRWESAVADPVTGWFCPLFHGPAWGYFVPADR